MSGVRFDSTISLGNVLVAASMVVAVTMAWTANRERSIKNEEAITGIHVRMADFDLRLRTLEVDAAKEETSRGN